MRREGCGEKVRGGGDLCIVGRRLFSGSGGPILQIRCCLPCWMLPMPFRLPTHVTIAPGCRRALPERIAAHGAHRVLLVVDAGLQETPWVDEVEAMLREGGAHVRTVDAVEPNPKHTTVDHLAEQARIEAIELVVGLGGGSVLDAAKAIALLLRNPGSCVWYEGRNRYDQPPAPFIALPTTCGTGSEVTWVSVITHAGERRKMSLKGEAMFPTAALVDADLLTTLPAALVTTTGLDALTHAVEATIGRAANPVSDVLAERAVALLLRCLRRAAADIAGDAEAREAVMRASTLAGMAFGNADVAGVHCLSEAIGGRYDLPHGLLNALLLGPVLRYQQAAAADRLSCLAAAVLLDADPTADALLDAIDALVADLALPPFASLDISPNDYEPIARLAVANNSNTSNPMPMTAADYRAILERL